MGKSYVTFMRTGELAQKIHVSRVHAWRLARAGIVPGTKKTKGGHFYFVQCPKLTRWINYMIGGAYRRKEMSRAYKKDYGSITIAQNKEELRHWAFYKRSVKIRKEYKNYINSYDDLFRCFYDDTDDLIRILEELTEWHECKLKAEMLKTSSERLIMLRDLINKWLNQQQSGRT